VRLTVRSDRWNRSVISRLSLPSTSRPNTARSRSESA
jgi:hypothetical protein